MYDESRRKADVLIASTDSLLLSLFDFVKLADDDNGWQNICAALEVTFKARDLQTTVENEPYLHFDDTVSQESFEYWSTRDEAVWNARLAGAARPLLLSDYVALAKP